MKQFISEWGKTVVIAVIAIAIVGFAINVAFATPAVGIPVKDDCERDVVKVIVEQPDICSKRLAEHTACQQVKGATCGVHRRAAERACLK